MLLVVGDDNVSKDHVRSLAGEYHVVTVASITAARDRCRQDGWDAVLVDRELRDPAVARLVRDLRNGGDDCPSPIPVVAVTDGSTSGTAVPEDEIVDEVVRTPVDEQVLHTTVQRAVRIGKYEEAIGQLFYACRRQSEPASPAYETASDPTGDDLGSVRRRADECLRALDACDGQLPVGRLLGT